MKNNYKQLLITSFALSTFTINICWAMQIPAKNADEINNYFQNTLNYIEANPTISEQMRKEIKNNEYTMNILNKIKNTHDANFASDNNICSKQIVENLCTKIIEDNDFAQKVLINLEIAPDLALELSTNDQILSDLVKKIQSDNELCLKILNSFNKKEKRKIFNTLN